MVTSLEESEIDLSSGQTNSWLKVTIKDSGIGISKENQKKLFKLFEFIKETQDDNTKGIGLGLMICNLIITNLDGSIEVESKEGQGSEFTFKVRLHQ